MAYAFQMPEKMLKIKQIIKKSISVKQLFLTQLLLYLPA